MKLSRDKIELQRAKKCMTMANMAQAYGVSRQRMTTILNQREATPVCAGRIAAALGVDVTEILEV